eukprot:Partr_v1_DN28151_c2_g1_i2_m55137 putative Cleaves proteins, imported into the mitochondrion, to their mature size. While most mitochondrial precursor proteins are processed to the mature form in one step by mitochondrial processing peptidase (MPP), the sequential cleavage by MIP of an octapeptide after initial processing by MPP is a required step for a subgroup of nuclear-encoded precursor proteins destined for the matrix or the inner membrane
MKSLSPSARLLAKSIRATATASTAAPKCGGLFGMHYLSSPPRFERAAMDTMDTCRHLVQSMLSSTSADPRVYIKGMDTLSDMICSIMDPAECIRYSARSGDPWRGAAERASSLMGAYVHELNTETGLYRILDGILLLQENGPTSSSPSHRRLEGEELAVASLLHRDFQRYGTHRSQVDRERVIRLSNEVTSVGYEFVLRRSKRLLHSMLDRRRELANVLGYSSYAQLFLLDKMAGGVAGVRSFIDSSKASSSSSPSSASSSLVSSSGYRSSTFDCSHVIACIADVYERLLGLRLVHEQAAVDECLSPSVHRIGVFDSRDLRVGTVYLDLSPSTVSSGTSNMHAVQFTVRCSRRIDNDGIVVNSSAGLFSSEYTRDLEYLGVASTQNGHVFQLPVVVVSLNIDQHAKLSWSSVETLFHEFGHAFHSMAARTSFQHVAGTRGVLDFVEVPSILAEMICNHPRVVSLLTGSPSLSRDSSAFSGDCGDQSLQLFYADLDLSYHDAEDTSDRALEHVSTEVFKRHPNVASGADPRFSHLYHYGSGYYSYPWCRQIARQVYNSLIKPALDTGNDSEISRAGSVLMEEVFSKGAAVDPWDFKWSRILGRPVGDVRAELNLSITNR